MKNVERAEGRIKTYTTVKMKKGTNSQSIIRRYVKNNEDGTQWTRMDSYSSRDDGKTWKKSSYIQNNSGKWKIIGEIAIKMVNTLAAPITKEPTDNKFEYTIKDDDFANVPCWRITVKTLRNLKVIYCMEVYVGKKNYFVYSTRFYDENGNMIDGFDAIDDERNIKFNVNIEDAMFEIPAGYKIMLPTDMDNRLNIELDARKKNKPISQQEVKEMTTTLFDR
jgi:hypothetical protein